MKDAEPSSGGNPQALAVGAPQDPELHGLELREEGGHIQLHYLHSLARHLKQHAAHQIFQADASVWDSGLALTAQALAW